MTEKKDNRAWFYIIAIVGIIIIYLIISQSFDKNSNSNSENQTISSNKVMINGIDNIKTIEQPGQIIYLRINGINNQIIISRDT